MSGQTGLNLSRSESRSNLGTEMAVCRELHSPTLRFDESDLPEMRGFGAGAGQIIITSRTPGIYTYKHPGKVINYLCDGQYQFPPFFPGLSTLQPTGMGEPGGHESWCGSTTAAEHSRRCKIRQGGFVRWIRV